MNSTLGKTPWWLWPTVLSADAPAVALSWQLMFARVLGVSLQAHHVALLATSVWLAYSGDRWIEAWHLDEGSVRTHRHRFALRRRWPLFCIWCGALVCALALALASLTRAEWEGSLLLLALTLDYLLLHQWLHRSRLRRFPKELCVAVIITCGAALYPALLAGRMPALLTMPLPSYILLALCNVSLISLWEMEVDEAHATTSLAIQTPALHRVISRFPWALTMLLLMPALRTPPPVRHALLAAALAAFLLGVVHLRHQRLGRMKARVLADLALLTPLAVVFL